MRLDRAYRMFLEEKRLEGCARRTIEAYDDFLGRVVADLGPGLDVADVAAPVRAWLVAQSKRGLADSTFYNFVKQVRTFCLFLFNSGWLSEKVPLPKTRRPRPDVRPMSPQQVRACLRAFDTSTFVGLRNQVIFRLMFATGIRRGELMRLEMSDLDMHNRIMRIQGKGGKVGIVPLPRRARRVLWQYIKARADRAECKQVFITRHGSPMTEWSIKHLFRTLKDKGIEFEGIRLSSHTLRHSFATNFTGDLLRLQDILRHESLSTTRIYVKLNPTLLKRAIDEHGPDELV